MILLAKAALGLTGTLFVAGAYTFHEGVIRIDVDEHREDGSHVHMWVPAAAIPMAMHLVPREHLRHAAEHSREFLPIVRAFLNGLKKYPDAELVEVMDGEQHVQIGTHHGKLQIDVVAPDQNVHLLCPLSTLDDVTSQLEVNEPGS